MKKKKIDGIWKYFEKRIFSSCIVLNTGGLYVFHKCGLEDQITLYVTSTR